MRSDRPSATARLIAAATILGVLDGVSPRHSERSVEISRRLLSGSCADRWLLRTIESRIGRAWLRVVERFVAPAMVRHFARRKAWIEETCRQAVADGFTRLIVVGAGFDTLGVRLSEEPSKTRVVEIDHPATQRTKRRLLGPALCAGVRFVEADLSTPEGAAMLGGLTHEIDCPPTVVVAEGLLMYLSERAVRAFFGAVAGLPSQRLRLVCTFMEPDGAGRLSFRPRRWPVGLWLRLKGEPFVWGASRAEVSSLLSDHGLHTVTTADERDLAARWPGPMLEGEVLLVAEAGWHL